MQLSNILTSEFSPRKTFFTAVIKNRLSLLFSISELCNIIDNVSRKIIHNAAV